MLAESCGKHQLTDRFAYRESGLKEHLDALHHGLNAVFCPQIMLCRSRQKPLLTYFEGDH